MTAECRRVRADDGCELHVEVEGHGAPLLLVSGLGGKADFWDPVRPSLRDRFRLVRFDHRGTGRSARPAGGYSVARIAADAIAILDALTITRAHVVGHSTGGAVAQILALDHPERVDRLVISASWARPDFRFRLLFETRLHVLERAGPGAYAALSQLLGFPPPWIETNADSVRAAIASAQADRAAQPAAEARLRMLLEHDRLDDLHRISRPTLVLGAADDMIVPYAHAEALAHRIAGARLVKMTGGHFFPQTSPDWFANAILGFLP